MHDPVGNAYWGAVGKMFDDQVTRMKAGLRARYPGDAAAMGMTDALELIGKDRMLPRGSTTTPGAENETLANWATRQQDAWATWAMAGTPQAILTELAVQGFPIGPTGTNIFNHIGLRYYLDTDGTYVADGTSGGTCVNRVYKDGTLPSPPLAGTTLHSSDQFYSCFCVFFLQDVTSLTNDAGNQAKAILNQTVRRYRQGGAHYVGAAVNDSPSINKVCGWPITRMCGETDLKCGGAIGRFIDTE
jgi:hypothetical protein